MLEYANVLYMQIKYLKAHYVKFSPLEVANYSITKASRLQPVEKNQDGI